jgi:hypothetical protein
MPGVHPLWFQKFDRTWTPIWPDPVVITGDADLSAADVAIAPDGSIVIAARLREDVRDRSTMWVNRYDPSGAVQRDTPFTRGQDQYEMTTTVRCDEEGQIYVGGFAITGNRHRAVLMKLTR